MTHPGWFYRYEAGGEGSGRPLTACPECRADLTAEDAVALELCVAGHTFEVRTRLTADGWLVDTIDRAVRHGYHSQTRCFPCGADLTAHEVGGGVPDRDQTTPEEAR